MPQLSCSSEECASGGLWTSGVWTRGGQDVIFLYLVVPGLSCSTGDLQSSLWHVGSLVVPWKPHSSGVRGLVFRSENPSPLHWEHRILATGPPRKSPLGFLTGQHLYFSPSLRVTSKYASGRPPFAHHSLYMFSEGNTTSLFPRMGIEPRPG